MQVGKLVQSKDGVRLQNCTLILNDAGRHQIQVLLGGVGNLYFNISEPIVHKDK